MKINRCQFCDGQHVTRGRYIGVSFWVMLVLTLGVSLFLLPLMPVTVDCRDCASRYIAS